MFLECKICNGKGNIENKEWGKISCTVCHGKGGFDIPNDKVLCPECNGNAHYKVIANRGRELNPNCVKCSGTGYI